MLVDSFVGCRMLVVGDVMLDHFVGGHVERVSPEAPALVLRVTREASMLGGAGNVATNISSVGGSAVLVGVIGCDAAGDEVLDLLNEQDRIQSALVRGHLRTTQKTRYIAGDRHLLRADREELNFTEALEDEVVEKVRAEGTRCDAIVLSDYAKGVISRRVVDAAVEVGRRESIPVVADPKRRRFTLYAGADLLTPNLKELEFASGEPCDDDEACERAAREVMQLTGSSLLLTKSDKGITVYEPGKQPLAEPAHAAIVRDVSGAGDTMVAVAALALAAGAPLAEAAHAANMAAAVAVSKSGTASVTAEELNLALLHSPDADAFVGKLLTVATARTLRDAWRAQGVAVGFTNGCFDLLHPGHVQLLREARQRCDRLIVAINNDASVRRLKGASRPVQTELARAAVIGALRAVDLVLIFGEDTPLEIIRSLQPDVLFKGADYQLSEVVGADLVESWGGRVELVPLVPAQSSSALIAASAESHQRVPEDPPYSPHDEDPRPNRASETTRDVYDGRERGAGNV